MSVVSRRIILCSVLAPWAHRLRSCSGNLSAPNRLENSRDRGAMWATVHGVPESWTCLSDYHKHTCGVLVPQLGIEPRSPALWGSPVAQTVKNLPAMRETWVPSLGGEDPLEEGMAAHSSILAWRISWTEGSGGLQSMGSQRVGHNWATVHTAPAL